MKQVSLHFLKNLLLFDEETSTFVLLSFSHSGVDSIYPYDLVFICSCISHISCKLVVRSRGWIRLWFDFGGQGSERCTSYWISLGGP